MTRSTAPAWRLLLVLLPVAAGCFGAKERSPFMRITVGSGRVYFANMDRALYSDSGGFLTFRDLVTREEVRLKNGTYLVASCSRADVDKAQLDFLDDPTRPPHVERP